MIPGALQTVRCWGEMVKFPHSVFALPSAMLATFLAARSAFRDGRAPQIYPGLGEVLLIIGCMVSARSTAMTFNRIVDAAIDARNPRTAGRAIPAGVISRGQALVFLAAAGLVFILCCAGFWWLSANFYPLLLSVPVLAYLCLYSYTKRFTRWSHFVLGSAIALSPAAAWVAIDPESLGRPALILLGAVTLWIGGFDIIYACQDVAADRADGLFSLPSRLGVGPALWIARLAHAGTVALLIVLAPIADLSWLYGAGVTAVALLLLIENAMVHPGDLSRVNVAFFNVNGLVSLLMGALGIADCLLL